MHRIPDGKRKDQLYVHFEAYLSVLQVLSFDEDAARLTGRFWAEQQAAGFNVQPPDMVIAERTPQATCPLPKNAVITQAAREPVTGQLKFQVNQRKH